MSITERETTVKVYKEASPMVVYRQLGRENLLLARRSVGSRESHDRRSATCCARLDDLQRTVGRVELAAAANNHRKRGTRANRPLLGCTREPARTRYVYTRVHAYLQWEETGKEQIRREQGSSRAHG